MTRIDYNIGYDKIYLNLVYVRDRVFFMGEDMEIVLSDGRTIIIPKWFETDLSSIPEWAWSLFKPFDIGLLGDLIHDYLWVNKKTETLYFGSAYKAQKFADEERLRWRKKLAPQFKIKNWVTHKILRIFGASRYSGKKRIPK